MLWGILCFTNYLEAKHQKKKKCLPLKQNDVKQNNSIYIKGSFLFQGK